MLSGQLYVMGGWDSNKLQVLEMSEDNQFSWTVKAVLPAERWEAASVVHEGKIWLIGGAVDWRNSDSVAIYDIEANSWGTGPALPRAVGTGRPHAITLNGEIYVVRSDGPAWVYRNAVWLDAADMPGIPGSRRGYALVCLGLG